MKCPSIFRVFPSSFPPYSGMARIKNYYCHLSRFQWSGNLSTLKTQLVDVVQISGDEIELTGKLFVVSQTSER